MEQKEQKEWRFMGKEPMQLASVALAIAVITLIILVTMACGPERPLQRDCYLRLRAMDAPPDFVAHVERQGDLSVVDYTALALFLESRDMGVCVMPPPYGAAQQAHDDLVARNDAVRGIWPHYLQEQSNLIEKQNNPTLKRIMVDALRSDMQAYNQWHQEAAEAERRSYAALLVLEGMIEGMKPGHRAVPVSMPQAVAPPDPGEVIHAAHE